MKVFIVGLDLNYDGFEIVALVDTKSKAEGLIKILGDPLLSSWEYVIREFELNKIDQYWAEKKNELAEWLRGQV